MQNAGKNSNQTTPSRESGLSSEIIRYLIFGVLTTLVSMISNFAVLWGGRSALGIGDNPEEPGYVALYIAAKAVSWVCAVIFAFFTNKKWVFRDKVRDRAGVTRQLLVFSGSRLATLGLDYIFNSIFLWGLTSLSLTFLDGLLGFSLGKINELAAWGLTQFFVVVTNYFISKWLVFRKKQP